MKANRIALYIFTVVFALFGASCTEKDSDVSTTNTIKITGVNTAFSPITVTTRGDNKTPEELAVNNMHMFLFGPDGNLLQCAKGYFQSYLFIERGSFVIDRSRFVDQAKAANATVCIVANTVKEQFFANGLNYGQISNINDLREYVIPYNGNFSNQNISLLLYGEEKLNLSSAGTTRGTLDINLKSLLAKIDINLTLVSSQPDNNLPSFTLTSWSLINIPMGVQLQSPTGETIINPKIDTLSLRNMELPGQHTITKGKTLSWSFYLSEVKCHPARNQPAGGYPPGILENEKQRFKPKLAKDKAVYLLLDGFYTGINGSPTHVVYKLYLGANMTSDFNILRNCRYENNITIKNLTLHDKPEVGNPDNPNVSFDTRVHINESNKPVIISVKRELDLDAHIEIRPMDFYMAKPGSKMEIELVNPSATPWVRFEKRNSATAAELETFCSNGKRKYFTTNLLTTLAPNIKTTITDNYDNRIWVYFDENNNPPSKTGVRSAELKMSYYANANDPTPTEITTYTFRQKNLFPVSYNSKNYVIEHFEEYLYNFDPKDNYGNTTDGMSWGLTNVQLSNTDKAINFSGGALSDMINNFISSINPYYDYDNSKHPYNGLQYTKKLIVATGHTVLPLDQNPRSAAEYCYNKNKRNADGTISDENIKWYMPGIDELEEIMSGAYSHFLVFQNKYYWSSQASYEVWLATYNGLFTVEKGTYFQDDKLRARTTKVLLNPNGSYSTIKSGVENNAPAGDTDIGFLGGSINHVRRNVTPPLEPGNRLRNEVNRVRCVRSMQ